MRGSRPKLLGLTIWIPACAGMTIAALRRIQHLLQRIHPCRAGRIAEVLDRHQQRVHAIVRVVALAPANLNKAILEIQALGGDVAHPDLEGDEDRGAPGCLAGGLLRRGWEGS